MDLGLDIAASGMVAQQVHQDQLSNDLANAATPGFKPDETPQRSFGSVLLANTGGGAAVGSVDEADRLLDKVVDSGVPEARIVVD